MAKEHAYRVEIQWTGDRGEGTSGYRSYARDHQILAQGKPAILGSSDPAFRGDPSRYNPEELFVASLSTCHMLWYLHLCSDAGLVVVEYVDEASGVMVMEADGGGQFREVVLHPRVTLRRGPNQDAEALDRGRDLHHRAHELCFIARSVRCEVRCEPELRWQEASADGPSN